MLQKAPYLRMYPKQKKKGSKSLNLQSIEPWNEQQQQSARVLIREYQHLIHFDLEQVG